MFAKTAQVSPAAARHVASRSISSKRKIALNLAPSPDADASNPSAAEPEYSLPESKLHHLINLYHRGNDFITMENLDPQIDAIFAPGVGMDQRPLLLSQKDLKIMMRNTRGSATLRHPDLFAANTASHVGDSVAARRTLVQMDEELRMAFFGGTSVPGRSGLPGLGIIRELKAQERAERRRERGGRQAREPRVREAIERVTPKSVDLPRETEAIAKESSTSLKEGS